MNGCSSYCLPISGEEGDNFYIIDSGEVEVILATILSSFSMNKGKSNIPMLISISQGLCE